MRKPKVLNVVRPLVAAWRDNSFYSSHGVARRYHVVTREGFSACGRVAVQDDSPEGPPSGVAEFQRCRHPACQKYFRESDAEAARDLTNG